MNILDAQFNRMIQDKIECKIKQKKCSKCSKIKNVTDFYKQPGGLYGVRGECKECNSNYYMSRQKEYKAQAIYRFEHKWKAVHEQMIHELKTNGCAICGYDKCQSALVFHHVNPEDKKFGIETRRMSMKDCKIKDEVEKCILLCCRCHREIHEEERKCKR